MIPAQEGDSLPERTRRRRRRSNHQEQDAEEEGEGSDRAEPEQDHHESSEEDEDGGNRDRERDRDTDREEEVTLQDDDHVNDEVYTYLSDDTPLVNNNNNTSLTNASNVVSTSLGGGHRRAPDGLLAAAAGSFNNNNSNGFNVLSGGTQLHVERRASPEPIDLIDIDYVDYDPSVSAHDSENQGEGDHDADGDQLPISPNVRTTSSYEVGGGRSQQDLYRRAASHQHEHYEASSFAQQLSESANSSSLSGNQNFAVAEPTEHLRTTSTSHAGQTNEEMTGERVCDQSEERQDASSSSLSRQPVTSLDDVRPTQHQHQHHMFAEDSAGGDYHLFMDIYSSTDDPPHRQNTPPAERSVEFADADITTSDHEEFETVNTFEEEEEGVGYLQQEDNLDHVHGSVEQVFLQSTSQQTDAMMPSVVHNNEHSNSNTATVSATQTEVSSLAASRNVTERTIQPQNPTSLVADSSNSSSVPAHWDLINFPRSFFQQADKEDGFLHRDKPFTYCGGSGHMGSRRGEHRRSRQNSGGDASMMNGHLQDFEVSVSAGETSSEGARSSEEPMDDSFFAFDPNLVESQLEDQLGASACGPTAVVNVLKILGYSVQPYYVARRVAHRQRDNLAPLPEYLISRSVAGSTHEDLIRGVETVTRGEVGARFFSFYPERKVCLRHWLLHWMRKGCVPVLTLNYQKKHPEASALAVVSDSWHHQPIIGVQHNQVYLTNLADQVHVATLSHYLCSESKLLVHWKDVWSRHDADSNLDILTQHPNQDPRWTDYNVLGQICSLLRMKKRIDEALLGATSNGTVLVDNGVNNNAVRSGITAAMANQQGIPNGQSTIDNYRNSRAQVNSAEEDEVEDVEETPRSVNMTAVNVDDSPRQMQMRAQNGSNGSVPVLSLVGLGNRINPDTTAVTNGTGFGIPSASDQTALETSLLPSHITIPSIVQAGITLFCRKSQLSCYQQLMQCDELKLKDDSTH